VSQQRSTAGAGLSALPANVPAVGEIVAGKFRVERLLGAGGMGVVVAARHTTLRQEVAIKFLTNGARIAGAAERFVLEAQAAIRIQSEHVARVFDVGTTDAGTPYIVMELLSGADLGHELDRVGRFSVADAVAYVLQACEAIAEAHAIGIVHRDLKPSNLFATQRPDGSTLVKVLDFGIAKATPLDGGPAITASGAAIGSPQYMSPEQLRDSKKVDPRSDIWSLGVTLHELVAGEPPFRGETAGAVWAAIAADAPTRLRDARADAPAELEAVILSCLEKKPALRLPDVGALARALEPFAEGAARLSCERIIRIIERSAACAPTGAPRVSALAETISFSQGGASPPASAPARPATAMTWTARSAADQSTKLCEGADGTRLAYATLGEGPPIVKAANWLSHLEIDWQGPMWKHWLGALSRERCLIRYDARGNGLSDRDPATISFGDFVSDLEAVFDAAGVERAPLIGISQGAAVATAYASRHPERVTALVLIGGCARGWRVKRHAALSENFEATMVLMRKGWGGNNAAFRQIFTTTFFPGASQEVADWFNELQRQTTSGETAAKILSALGDVDVRDDLPRVKAPTIVFHSRGDAVVPMKDGIELATGIAGARFVPLESSNHMLLPEEPAWAHFVDELERFLGEASPAAT